MEDQIRENYAMILRQRVREGAPQIVSHLNQVLTVKDFEVQFVFRTMSIKLNEENLLQIAMVMDFQMLEKIAMMAIWLIQMAATQIVT